VNELPRALKHTTLWLLLGTAVFLAVQAWLAQQRQPRIQVADGRITLRRAADGHFHWPGQVNGVAVQFLVDTGASRTALPQALAAQAGLRSEGTVQSATAGGTVQGRLAHADVQLQGGVSAQRLLVTVLPDLASPLLGMDVLSRLQFSQAGGVLQLQAATPPTTR
jgi:aspartyl protease family protein